MQDRFETSYRNCHSDKDTAQVGAITGPDGVCVSEVAGPRSRLAY